MEANKDVKFYILIVEDDRPLAGGLCRALQNDSTMTESCHSLREAEALLDGTDGQVSACNDATENNNAMALPEKAVKVQTSYDLVILDVNLPDGNGFDFLQEVKTKYDICVIMLTANDMETDIVAGLEAGADDYITKPFSLAVLRARVETQLRRVAQSRQAAGSAAAGKLAAGGMGNGGTAAAESTGNGSLAGIFAQEIVTGEAAGDGAQPADEGWITDGAYRFHFAKMLFFHGDEQVELSKTEQRILRMLVENKGITLTREQLLDFTWSVDAAFVDENTLSVAVKRLRDKLGAQERIKTVYGIGYRWEW